MKDYDKVYQLLREHHTVQATPRLIAEFNYNRYANPVASNTPATNENSQNPDLFPIESIIEGRRPGAGIVAARVDEWIVEEDFELTDVHDNYYVSDEKDIYKYWVGPDLSAMDSVDDMYPFPEGTTEYPTDINPQVIYEHDVKANKIVIGFENTFTSPSDYEIFIKSSEEGEWTKIASALENDLEIDEYGRVVIYYDGSQWTQEYTSNIYTSIRGIQLRVYSMFAPDSFFNLIEIGARLQWDMTSYLMSVNDTFDLGDTSTLRPIGEATSQVAEIKLFNHYDNGFTFNDDNEDSLFAGLMEENVKFTLDYIYNIEPLGGTEVAIRQFEMYATSHWSAQKMPQVEISLRDSSKFLQETKSPALFYEQKTVHSIIYRALDSIGFNQYDVNSTRRMRVDGQWVDLSVDPDPLVIPYFWANPEDTLWDTIQSLASDTQTAIYFDEWDRLQILTRNQAFANLDGDTWTLRGNSKGKELTDIQEFTVEESDVSNDVTVNYQTTEFEEYVSGIRRNTIVWQPEDETVYVKSSALAKDLNPTDTTMWLTPAEAALWPFESSMAIESEFLKYKGKEYAYYPNDYYTVELSGPVEIKYLTYNINGGYHGDWATRLPMIVGQLNTLNADLILLQEAHTNAGEHQAIVDGLHGMGRTEYELVEGAGDNHMIINSDVLELASSVTNWSMPLNRYASTVKLKHKQSDLIFTAWNTHFIAGNGAGRTEQAKYLAPILKGLGPRIGGGDFNNYAYSKPTYPMAILDANGDIDVRYMVSNTINVNYDSFDGYGSNAKKGQWIDHLFASEGPIAIQAGLYDTGQASDHNIIWSVVRFQSTVTEVVGVPEIVWLESYDDYKKYHFDLTPVKNRFLNKFTGQLKITERGMWNTPVEPHIIDTTDFWDQINVKDTVTYTDKTGFFRNSAKLATYKNKYDTAYSKYKKRKTSANKKTYNAASSAYKTYAALYEKYKNAAITDGIDIPAEKSTIQMVTNSDYSRTHYLMCMHGDATEDLGYRYYGTRIKFNTDSSMTDQLAGIRLLTLPGDVAGWMAEICPKEGTNGVGVVRIYRRDATGKLQYELKKDAVILYDTWYSLDVRVEGSENTARYLFNVYLNGELVLSTPNLTGANKTDYTGRFGLFARYKTNVSFEYVYAIGGYEHSMGDWPDNFATWDRLTGGFGSSRFTSYVSEQETGYFNRKIKGKLENIPLRYSHFVFDEFGPMCHEIREFNVKYDTAGLPVMAPYVYWTNTGMADLYEVNSDSYESQIYMINAARQDAALQGTDDGHQFCVYGLVLKQRDTQSVNVQDKKSISTIGSKQLTVESRWIQSEEAAQALGDWITEHWGKARDNISLSIFGNPLIQVGDVVAIDIEDVNMHPETHKYFVISTETDFSEGGMTTSLRLRRVRN